jgi:hypothetical protein
MQNIIVTHVIKDMDSGEVIDTRITRIPGGHYALGYPRFCPRCPEMIRDQSEQQTHNTVRHPA